MSLEQLSMFEILEPAPAVQPMHATRWEFLAVTDRGELTEAAIEASYSGASLCESGKVLRPFQLRGADWVETGSSHLRGDSDRECYWIVPLADFAGPGEPRTYHDHNFFSEHREEFGGYHGMQAKNRSADVVLIGPPLILVIKARNAERRAA